jgi:RNA polymerase sigma-70 factor (ECF subfamily)
MTTAPASVCCHGQRLYRVALHLTGNHDDAMDLVQTTYERALRRGFAAVPAEQLRGWLVTIARNQFIDRYRTERCRTRREQRPANGEDLTVATMDDADQPAWRELTRADLDRAVERLTPPLARTYRLHAFENLDYAGIAVLLQIPLSTVGTRLLRARRQLRGILFERAGASTAMAG